MKALIGIPETITEILKSLENEDISRYIFRVDGGKLPDSHGSLSIDIPLANKGKPNYQLLWVEKGYVPFMYLTTIGFPGEVLASNLSHEDVLNIVKKALDNGLEDYIQKRLFKEPEACSYIKEKGYCKFCSPIVRDRDYLKDWLVNLIKMYREMITRQE